MIQEEVEGRKNTVIQKEKLVKITSPNPRPKKKNGGNETLLTLPKSIT